MLNPRRLILVAVLCGATQLTAQTAPVTNGGTGAAIPAQQDQSAPPPTVPKAKVTPKPFPCSVKNYWFIEDLVVDQALLQRDVQDNPKRFPPDFRLQVISSRFGIRPEEAETLLTYVLDAHDRLKENDRESNAALMSFRASPGYSFKSVPPAELTALEKQHDAIVTEMMDSLKRELGDEAYNKLPFCADTTILLLKPTAHP